MQAELILISPPMPEKQVVQVVVPAVLITLAMPVVLRSKLQELDLMDTEMLVEETLDVLVTVPLAVVVEPAQSDKLRQRVHLLPLETVAPEELLLLPVQLMPVVAVVEPREMAALLQEVAEPEEVQPAELGRRLPHPWAQSISETLRLRIQVAVVVEPESQVDSHKVVAVQLVSL